jgi:hypothetical protein
MRLATSALSGEPAVVPSNPDHVATRAAPDDALDIWIKRGLLYRYAAVSGETIPQ